MSNNAIMMAGDVLVDIFDETGKRTGFQRLEADLLKVEPKSDTKEEISRGRDTYGQSFVTAVVPKPTEFELRVTEVTREILATMLAGRLTKFSQSAGALSAKVSAILDRWVEIGTRHLSGIVVKDAGGTTTYVEGTDYAVNTRLGLLRALPGGAIADGAELAISGSTLAVTGARISGAQRYQFKLIIQLDGKNLVTGENVIFEALEAVVTPTEAQDFLDDKFMTATLKGRLNLPTNGTVPYRLEVID